MSDFEEFNERVQRSVEDADRDARPKPPDLRFWVRWMIFGSGHRASVGLFTYFLTFFAIFGGTAFGISLGLGITFWAACIVTLIIMTVLAAFWAAQR
ncbi:MAG: hypothetical protein QNJ35_03375 [Paracoccaceae bacterium]|nr:hypothetical protein [Paracoccaceae bacterium]